ncbi:MAG: phosphoribosylformylglycinamidine synthase I [Candidatus Velthaea sp.]
MVCAAARFLRRRGLSARVAVPVFPGTNSEHETLRALHAVGVDAGIVHWSRGARTLRDYDAFVVPGGFAYEDRVRAGAVAAHDELTDAIIEGAHAGKLVLGICNGAQILVEAGLVPGTGPLRRPTAAFTPNTGGRFVCRHVHVRLEVDPARLPVLGALAAGEVIPMWMAHGEGRLQAAPQELHALQTGGHVAFVYCDARGNRIAAPNGSALDCAGLTNAQGNVLALMPHPERDAWAYMHRDAGRDPTGTDTARAMRPSGGIMVFEAFARALRGVAGARR